MAITDFINKEPKQFVQLHRSLAYFMLALLVIIYSAASSNITYQFLLPVLFFFLIIFEPRLGRWIQYSYGISVRKYIIFLIDVFVCCTCLAAVHLSLVPSFVIICALIYSAINSRISVIVCSMGAALGIAIFYLQTMLFFGFQPYFQQTNIEVTALTLLGFMLFISVANYYQIHRIEQLNQQKLYYIEQMNRYLSLTNKLSRYAPLQLWQAIMRGETEAKIEYKRKKLTVFFSDIQGFTELSENLIPDDLAFLLNDYLTHMTDIVKQYGGTIDKFMGDGILVFFGDLETQGVEKDAKSCMDMALAMRTHMKILRERWRKMGYPELHIRMGISTGYCHVGNYGTAHRMSYTIVGRDVNLASRLQAAAEIDEILISEETHQLIKNDYLCIPKRPIQLKGIQNQVNTWQVVEKHQGHMEKYQQWFDYEYKGFHLMLNLDEIESFEYAQLVNVLEAMVERIKIQQQMTNPRGIVKLDLKDAVKLPKSTFNDFQTHD